MKKRQSIFILFLLVFFISFSSAWADDDTLRDLGPSATPGESPKWDGNAWRNAHDDVGISNVVAGEGIVVSETNGEATVSANFSGSGSSKIPRDNLIAPVGSVEAWLKSFPNTPALPAGWVECNGQTLSDSESPYNGQAMPDLNGVSDTFKRFLRGSTASGATGGRETHKHTYTTRAHEDGSGSHSNDRNSTENHVPPYYEVVWIMRVR